MASKTSPKTFSEQGKLWVESFLKWKAEAIYDRKPLEKSKGMCGNLIVSNVTSGSFMDSGGGWNSSRKKTMTYIVVKRVKWRKVCNIINLFLGISQGLCTAPQNNDPRPQILPQIRPQMIPNRKWSPMWTASDPSRKIWNGMELVSIFNINRSKS